MKLQTKIFIGVILILASGLAIFYFSWKQERHERIRHEANEKSLIEGMKAYQSKDSLNAATIQALTFSNSEFKRYNQDLTKTVENLNLKVKNLQSASQTGTETNYKVKIQVKDSLIYLAGRIDTLKCVDFSDNWLTVSGCVKKGQFSGIIQSRDTIETFISRVPHRFLFFRYGTKAIRQDVVSKNPHSKIVFTKYIELKNGKL